MTQIITPSSGASEKNSALPKDSPLLILKNIVVFPHNVVPVVIGRTESINAIEESIVNAEGKLICVGTQIKSDSEDITAENIYHTGTLCTILQLIRMQKGAFKILLEGKERIHFEHIEKKEDYFVVRYAPIPSTTPENEVEFEGAWRGFNKVYATYAKYNQKLADHHAIITSLHRDDVSVFIDALSGAVSFKTPDKIALLEEQSLTNRITMVMTHLTKEIDIAQTEEKIRSTVQKNIESSQKEYYLLEQLRAIQKELKKETGEEEEYKKKIKKIKLSAEAREKVEREITRLEGMASTSPEAAVSRNYIEWILMLPWGTVSKDRLSIHEAEEILDKNHFGLSKVKERILELIAAQKYSKEKKRQPIICLVGPPGVGKTSLGKSIAESLNREFVRISVGGARDESEIRGHRRTYVAATPGKIIQGMKQAKTINPVFLIDEIDKLSRDFHGDPGAALLEVLDPELNSEFSDSFIDVAYDLSRVLFILTANTIETIHYPLLDRMEIVALSGYTKEEKIAIAEKFIIPKQLKEHSINEQEIVFHPSALKALIEEYIREAGVRQLERYIIRAIRKGIRLLLKDKTKKVITIDQDAIYQFFKAAPFKNRLPGDEEKKPGTAVGLAWTEFGGDVLDIEVAIIPGKGTVTITGQLGEVMQESAQAAFTYVKSHREELGISKKKMSQYDVHIHVPEGATPKDGPSAGITMCTALASAFCDIPIKKKLAMTGEITLQGNVLGIGGIKDKLLAAISYGYTTVIMPKENEELCKEILEELGDTIKNSVHIIYAHSMKEVLEYALPRKPATKEKRKKTLSNKKSV